MEEKERVVARIEELIGDEEERARCLELLDAAVSGVETGLSSAAEERIKGILNDLVRELDEIAERIRGAVNELG